MSKELEWDEEVQDIVDAATVELAAETRRTLIDAVKIRLRQRRPLWHRLFPWKFSITRR